MMKHWGLLLLIIAFIPAQSGCDAAASMGAAGAEAPVRPVVLRTIPHDPLAFTQGLVYASGKLYESTGLVGRSSLRRIDPEDGRVEQLLPIDAVFAEGLARMDDRLVVLSLHAQRALVFSIQDFTPLGAHEFQGEGWGLASDGDTFFMSNGTDMLFQRDRRFAIIRAVPVRYNGRPPGRLNELEVAGGKIYANVWPGDVIVVIDPESGAVTRTIDCSPLVRAAAPRGDESVLNGIAYNADAGTFYLTGKNWPVMFEVRIPD